MTPEFESYADGVEDGCTGSPAEIKSEEVPTPEGDDNYVRVSLSLPRGSEMARGRATKRISNKDGHKIQLDWTPGTSA